MFVAFLSKYVDCLVRHCNQKRSVERVNKARAKVNKEVGRFVRQNGGIVVRHRELEGASNEFLGEERHRDRYVVS